MNHLWKLSSFDTFCLGMNIKSAWIYKKAPDFERMKTSLQKIASMYPILNGHYIEKEKAVVWDDTAESIPVFEKMELGDYSISQLTGNASLAWSLVKSLDIKGFKKGKVSPFSATLGYLKDGCILYVQCAHAIMDAHTFYSLIRQWTEVYKGNDVLSMKVDQDIIPSKETYTKEETIRLIQQKGWPLITFKKLVKMIVNLIRNHSIKETTTIEISQSEISKLKEESGVGTNAVLSAITFRKIAERIPENKKYKILFTVDLRERIDGIEDDFFGNMSQPVVLKDDISIDNDNTIIASLIENNLRQALDNDLHKENVCLSMCSSHYGLQYAPFDVSNMNCPGNSTIYINNFLKFRANEINWGESLPEYTFVNELSDMVKLWQPIAGGPVQIILGGYAAKLMK